MCGGVRRHVTQSHLERAQRAMHDVRPTPSYDRRAIDRSKQQLDELLFARLKTNKSRYEL